MSVEHVDGERFKSAIISDAITKISTEMVTSRIFHYFNTTSWVRDDPYMCFAFVEESFFKLVHSYDLGFQIQLDGAWITLALDTHHGARTSNLYSRIISGCTRLHLFLSLSPPFSLFVLLCLIINARWWLINIRLESTHCDLSATLRIFSFHVRANVNQLVSFCLERSSFLRKIYQDQDLFREKSRNNTYCRFLFSRHTGNNAFRKKSNFAIVIRLF